MQGEVTSLKERSWNPRMDLSREGEGGEHSSISHHHHIFSIPPMKGEVPIYSLRGEGVSYKAKGQNRSEAAPIGRGVGWTGRATGSSTDTVLEARSCASVLQTDGVGGGVSWTGSGTDSVGGGVGWTGPGTDSPLLLPSLPRFYDIVLEASRSRT